MNVLTFEGRVFKGEGIAAGLGCPTANIAVQHGGIIPGLGVYTGEAEYNGIVHPAVICANDGRTGALLKLEVHLLNQTLPSLEGRHLRVRLFEKLRSLVPWESEEQMRECIRKDLEAARNWFKTRE